MARLASQTTWTVTDAEESTATVRIDETCDTPTLKIEQGEDHMVWLSADAAPSIIRALQGAYDAFTASAKG